MMDLLSWVRKPKPASAAKSEAVQPFHEEKTRLKQQLADTSVTFERRWNRIQPIAEQALHLMKEGHRG